VTASRRVHQAEARKRLQGTWQSDAAKTTSNWVFPRKIAASKIRRFRAIFGKMTWVFSARGIATTFEDVTTRGRYSILWADEHSAVVLFSSRDGERCQQLFFEDKWFFLVAGQAGNVEYFRKIGSRGR
jgi:hypothetical protein